METLRTSSVSVPLCSIASGFIPVHSIVPGSLFLCSAASRSMELLLQVRGEDLIEYIETPEVTIVDNEISELDLTDHYTKNSIPCGR